jgi:TPP-dependent 2-oxoacid decarboxylase
VLEYQNTDKCTTSGFSYKTSQLNTIDFHSTYIAVRYSQYPGVHMKGVLRKVAEKVDMGKLQAIPGPKMMNKVKENQDNSETITQAWFWPRVGEFLKENDIVITETGYGKFRYLGDQVSQRSNRSQSSTLGQHWLLCRCMSGRCSSCSRRWDGKKDHSVRWRW